MALRGLDHINIDTVSVDDTVHFYCGVLGLENREKPSGNPGVWLYLGELPLVHVNPVEGEAVQSTGRFNHFAFAGNDYEALCAVLDDNGFDYDGTRKPDEGRAQIFVRDPNGIMVEITCPCPPAP